MAKKSGKKTAATKATKAAKPKAKSAAKPAIKKPVVVPAPVPAPAPKAPLKTKISNPWQLTKVSFVLLWKNHRLFLGITGIYGLLSLLFQGQGLFSVNNISGLDKSGSAGSLGSAIGSVLGGSSSASNGASATFQFFLMILVSLALIYTLRQIYAKQPISVRDAYYKSGTPFVPYMLVLFVVALQLLPFLASASVYQVLVFNNIVVGPVEQGITALLAIGLAFPSLYMTTASVFALYIVTLANMRPMLALRSARELVNKRRLKVFSRIVVLPFLLLAINLVLLVPAIIINVHLAQVMFFAVTIVSFAVMHTYLYTLYRELLGE